MAWLSLFFAGLTEIGWAIALKYSHGFTRLIPSILAIGVMILSFFPSCPFPQNDPHWYGLCSLDRYRHHGYCHFGNSFI